MYDCSCFHHQNNIVSSTRAVNMGEPVDRILDAEMAGRLSDNGTSMEMPRNPLHL